MVAHGGSHVRVVVPICRASSLCTLTDAADGAPRADTGAPPHTGIS
eukprot:gene50877-14582_t